MSSKHHRYAFLAAAFCLSIPVQAWAESTVVIRPTGTAKQRNIDKVTKSIAEQVTSVEDLALIEIEAGAECTIDPACLASAGADDGVTRVVGVHLSKEEGRFRLLMLAVDPNTLQEIARHEIESIKRKDLASVSGPGLLAFVAALPEVAPIPSPAIEVEGPEVETPETETPETETPETETPETETPDPYTAEFDTAEVEGPEAEGPEVESPEVESPAVEEEEYALQDSVTAETDLEFSADEQGTTEWVDTFLPYRVELGLATGVSLPQISSELGTAATFEVDVGVPVWKSLAVVGAVAYSQPSVDSSLMDRRLPGRDYSTETTQRELTVTAGATWRFLPPDSRFNAYGGLGPRLYLLETVTSGKSGNFQFGENQEQSTRIGAAFWGGAEYLIGPGAATAELDLGGSDLPHAVTGDVSTTALALQVGYRLRL